jgi:hypothetical protein
MIKQRYPSSKALLNHFQANDFAGQIDNVLIVAHDDLFWYFSPDAEKYYNLIMSSSKNLSEEQ